MFFLFIIFIIDHVTIHILSDIACHTVKGDRCSFPFEYNGERFHSCTPKHRQLNPGEMWCQTDSATEPKWGVCTDSEQCNSEASPGA